MWYWVVAMSLFGGGMAFIVGMRRFSTSQEAVDDLALSRSYIEDVELEKEAQIVEIEIVYKRER